VAAPVDLQLLRMVNGHGTPAFDAVMVAASNRFLLFGIALAAAIYLGVRSVHRWTAALLLLLAIATADLVSVRVVKPAVDRVRPCHSLASVRAPSGCGSGKSFPSAHASDTAAAAAVVTWALPALAPFAAALAAVVGLSRVYLGVHYPSDVVAGWILGGAVGAVLVWLARLRHAVRVR